MAPRLLNTGEAAGLAELVMGNLNELTFDTGFFSREANRGVERNLSLIEQEKREERGSGEKVTYLQRTQKEHPKLKQFISKKVAFNNLLVLVLRTVSRRRRG